jgi:hypothetical protein
VGPPDRPEDDVGLRFRWECPWLVVSSDDVVGSKMKLCWDCNNDRFAIKLAGQLGGVARLARLPLRFESGAGKIG